MSGVTVDFHLDGDEHKKLRLVVKENGFYSVMIGKESRLTLIGELHDLNDLAFEFYLQTSHELKRKRLKMVKAREGGNMKMFCLECQNEWRSNGADRSSYKCPKCGAYDVMPILPRNNRKEKRINHLEAGQTRRKE